MPVKLNLSTLARSVIYIRVESTRYFNYTHTHTHTHTHIYISLEKKFENISSNSLTLFLSFSVSHSLFLETRKIVGRAIVDHPSLDDLPLPSNEHEKKDEVSEKIAEKSRAIRFRRTTILACNYGVVSLTSKGKPSLFFSSLKSVLSLSAYLSIYLFTTSVSFSTPFSEVIVSFFSTHAPLLYQKLSTTYVMLKVPVSSFCFFFPLVFHCISFLEDPESEKSLIDDDFSHRGSNRSSMPITRSFDCSTTYLSSCCQLPIHHHRH